MDNHTPGILYPDFSAFAVVRPSQQKCGEKEEKVLPSSIVTFAITASL